MDFQEKKKELVELLLTKNILPTPEILNSLETIGDIDRFCEKILNEKLEDKPRVKILYNYEPYTAKITAMDFTKLFRSRLNKISKILRHRQELAGTTSINKIFGRREREKVSLIGMVNDIQTTKNKNLIISLEDETGIVKIIITKKSPAFEQAKDTVLDEVIGVRGSSENGVVFASNIIIPDIPLDHELKKSPSEGYAALISDIHVGSTNFMEEEFKKFIKWLTGNTGSEKQREIAKKVKYLFIVGDLVAGVGIYPTQERELNIPDIRKQYEYFVDLMKDVPENIKIIICPGNHDAVRLAEPQPIILNEFTESLKQLKNTTFLSNPSIVNIDESSDFPGFDVLLYHGYSYDYYGSSVDSIKNSGKNISDRTIPVMHYLLRRRHLAPQYGSTQYCPEPTDNLVIDKVPDLFFSGHEHKAGVLNYRGVTLVCGSCWESKTEFQEKVGHEPEPCRVPIVNLKTRAVTMMRFGG